MSSSDRETSNLAFVWSMMQDIADVMSRFPADFEPPDVPPPESGPSIGARRMHAATVAATLSDPEVQRWLQRVIDSWPRGLLPLFLQASGILAQILEMFGARGDDTADLLEAGLADVESMKLMMALAQLEQQSASSEKGAGEDAVEDPIGMKQAFVDEIRRRALARRTPFARTLTTLLGHDALLWLTAGSQDGTGKLQPHEFSRTGWSKIWRIENQLAIEEELGGIVPEAQYLARIVVALSWTLAALGSYMQPAIFLGEGTPHLSSMRDGQHTVSVGTGTHTLVTFEPAAMLAVVRILAEGLRNPVLSAADLMWIGAGVARVREVRSGTGEAVMTSEEQFALFLSHRGRDAKRPLSEVVQALGPGHGIFLDCLTLPRGVVNRSFVYGSLARSEDILIVETENFQESDWCRKEAWFADALSANGLAKTERVTLDQAAARVATEGPSSTHRRARLGLQYPIAPRVLRDIDYWARTPNLHSLKEAGEPVESLVPLQSALENAASPDDPAWVRGIGEAIAASLSATVEAAPNAVPFDLWATALQYSLAAIGSSSNARSKMEVRRGVDQLNGVLNSVVAAQLHHDPAFQARAAAYLALLAAASAIDLAGFELDPRMVPALRIALADAAGLRDGLLLLDVRQPGPTRTLHLRLLATLVKSGIGSVGIVQDAADEVHRGHIDEFPIDVLPCVTLYPGMRAPFGGESVH